MKIEYLADHPEHVPLLAKWFHNEWGYLSPGYELEEREKRLRAKANREAIPISFIAMDGERPIGSASLVECDMDTRSHLKPWLSSVYVQASSRRHGAGTALVSRVIHEARQHGFSSVYLWTPTEEEFYRKRGWRTLERTRYKNENAVVMEYALGDGLANNSSQATPNGA